MPAMIGCFYDYVINFDWGVCTCTCIGIDMDLSTDSIPEITSTSESIITKPDNQFHTTAERDSNDSKLHDHYQHVCTCTISYGLLVIPPVPVDHP